MKKLYGLILITECEILKESIKELLQTTDIKIALLATFKAKEFRDEFEKQIDCILPVAFKDNEFEQIYQNTYNLTYEEIKFFRSTQLKVEHYFQRFNADKGIILYRYFMALSFWLDFFGKNDIALVFSAECEHGRIFDTIAIDIARSKNIPVYIMSVMTGDYSGNIISSICNGKSFLNLKEIYQDWGGGQSVDFKNYFKGVENYKKAELKMRKFILKIPINIFLIQR